MWVALFDLNVLTPHGGQLVNLTNWVIVLSCQGVLKHLKSHLVTTCICDARTGAPADVCFQNVCLLI